MYRNLGPELRSSSRRITVQQEREDEVEGAWRERFRDGDVRMSVGISHCRATELLLSLICIMYIDALMYTDAALMYIDLHSSSNRLVATQLYSAAR